MRAGRARERERARGHQRLQDVVVRRHRAVHLEHYIVAIELAAGVRLRVFVFACACLFARARVRVCVVPHPGFSSSGAAPSERLRVRTHPTRRAPPAQPPCPPCVQILVPQSLPPPARRPAAADALRQARAARASRTGPPTTRLSIVQPLRIMPTVDLVLKPDALDVAGIAKRSSALILPCIRSTVSRHLAMAVAPPGAASSATSPYIRAAGRCAARRSSGSEQIRWRGEGAFFFPSKN